MSIKIVIDTSVFISALIGQTGASREVIRRCLKKEYTSLMGNALFCEYESVMNRTEILNQCPLEKTEVISLFSALISVSEWVHIYYSWRPNLRDEGDNHLIELAIAGNASSIVTNNIKDFKNTTLLFPNLSILKPEEILRS
ncbi:putative toxin-antitoxin system toxin component, PIN family [Oscillatoria sp. FACHB-1406]|nr:putative toxin-antitoxin system toxin component, PIN family [Oscillatoria sp. FACHB-1406]